MMIFAFIFLGLTVMIAVFQIALALGAPLGEFTLGGRFPGKLPGKMRIAALFQLLILFLFTVIVLSKAGIGFESLYSLSKTGIWFVVAFFVIGSILNLSSSSKKEKMLMGPLNIIALVSVFLVGIG